MFGYWRYRRLCRQVHKSHNHIEQEGKVDSGITLGGLRGPVAQARISSVRTYCTPVGGFPRQTPFYVRDDLVGAWPSGRESGIGDDSAKISIAAVV